MKSCPLLKSTFLFFLLCAFISEAYSQIRAVEITHYLFPEFTKGVILMKSKIKNEAMLNYNSLTEEMIFENKGIKLALDHLEQVDTIYITGRKFFILNNKFVELIYSSKFDLYAEHRCTIKDPGKPAAYGGTSQTSATNSYATYFSGGRVYDLKLPEGFEPLPYIQYWLKKDGKLTKFINIRQLAKLFNDKEDLYKQYNKKHVVKYDDQTSLVELLRYLAEN